MINIKATTLTAAADRAAQQIRNTPGLLREIIEQFSAPRLEALADSTLRTEPSQPDTFKFGSPASRRWYFAALNNGTIPFREVGGKRVYARQGVLSSSWRLRIDTRRLGSNGGIVAFENRATDVLGRPFPSFVYNRIKGSTSTYKQQPGHFHWNKDFTGIMREMSRIVSSDIRVQFKRKFKRK